MPSPLDSEHAQNTPKAHLSDSVLVEKVSQLKPAGGDLTSTDAPRRESAKGSILQAIGPRDKELADDLNWREWSKCPRTGHILVTSKRELKKSTHLRRPCQN